MITKSTQVDFNILKSTKEEYSLKYLHLISKFEPPKMDTIGNK